ncbi:hypothetical protein [Kitasatospora sp. NPDC054795]
MHLTTLARHALSRGRPPADTYPLLVRRTREPLPSARAVCLALDIPLAETARRLADCYEALLLTTAYLSLTAARPMPRTGDPALYWTTLVTAGELLTTTHHSEIRITYALAHCRAQATRARESVSGN